MLTTLNHLDSYNHKQNKTIKSRKILKEVRNFILIFIVVGFCITVFTNWNLFALSFMDIFEGGSGNEHNNVFYTAPINETDGIVSSTGTIESNQEKQKIEKLLSMENNNFANNGKETILENYLQKKIGNYNITFNTLPPVDRLIIPKIGQNNPIVNPKFQKPIEEIKKGDFEKELYKGIVKYPTTPNPGRPGNTLIFGHTSYESWKYNPYGTVFRNLPKLKYGDKLQIIWEGHLYNYQVITKKIIKPKNINKFYLKYNNKKQDILTLMGCYPLGSDKDRIVVVLEGI